MKSHFQRWISAAAILFFAGWAHAQPTVHTATSAGNYTSKLDYTTCATGPCQNFTLAMGVSGSFTTASPLAGNLAGASIPALVTSFNFSDGLTTYSSADPATRIYIFQVTTNAAGAVTDAAIVLNRWETGLSPHAANDRTSLMAITGTAQAGRNYRCLATGTSPAGAADSCDIETADSGASEASGARISWSSAAVASIPTLSQWGLIIMSSILGLAGLAAMRRRPL